MPCSTFQNIAIRTWWRMHNNFNTSIRLREDGFTSLNLQDIYILLNKNITVFDFNAKEESNITGADWEWWFLDKSGFFGAAVQAKRLKSNNKYDVGYIPPSNKYPQIERLLDYSIKNSISPMYCFYNWFSTIPVGTTWPCGSFPRQDDLLGCTLADAWTVYAHHKKREYSANVYLGFSEPWHCITCCRPVGADSATRASEVTKRLVSHGKKLLDVDYPNTYKNADIPTPKIHETLPDRVIKMIQMGNKETIGQLTQDQRDNLPRRLLLLGDLSLCPSTN